MVMHVALTHETSYRYDKAVKLGPQIVRLRPAPHCPARVLSYTMRIFPEEHFLNWQQDPQSNFIARILVPEKTPSFKISVDLVVEMAVVNPFDYFLEPHAEKFPFAYEPWLAGDLAPYLITETPGPRLRTWLDSVSRESMETNDFLVALNARLKDDIGYIVRMETGIQSCEETLELARGSCRDSGWLLVQILRHLGLAARFVSGYLIQLKPDVKSLDGPTGEEEDFTDLHAWAEVYLPGAGWVGLDPTSGLFAGEGHIPLACTPDPGSAAPISGITEEAEVDFSFSMGVKRIFETPRVTKPYSEDQWRAIDALGKRIADLLARSDVRLTMGGEPTFVSIDDMEGEEWTTDAVGPTKRELAATLIGRLRDRYAPGGLLHFGQGKWYPGESLPRWSFSLYWRSDGQVLWRDPELIAGEVSGGDPSVAEAEEFTQALAETLDIDRDYIMPAFEDPLPHLGQEQQLPENVDVFDSKLEDPERRARIVRVFERGLDQPVGFALPLQRWNAKDERRWRSEKWSFRRKRLFLTPGDSPLGFRLPLESLHHVSPEAYPFYIPADPFAARSPLAPPAARRRQRAAIAPPGPDPRQAPQRLVEQGSPGGDGMAVRTALSVESRDGRLSVFLPPTESAEDYVELVTAIEDTAVALDQRVNLEGYTPPKDDRLNVIRVTPDPGVIEVNIHPAGNWDELVEKYGRTLRGRTALPFRYREIHARWPSHRDRRRQPRRRGRPNPGGQSFLAPPGPPAKPDYLLAEPSLAVLSVLGPFHRADESGPPSGRSPRQRSLRARARVLPDSGAGDRMRALAGRPHSAQPSDRRQRQHAPVRNLYRQALFPRWSHRALGTCRIPRLRDAPPRPHEFGSATPATGLDRPFLAPAVPAATGALEHAVARPVHASEFCLAGFS